MIQKGTQSLNPISTFILPTLGTTLLFAAATAPTLLGPLQRVVFVHFSAPSSPINEKFTRTSTRRVVRDDGGPPIRPESRHLGLDGLPDNPRISVARRAAGFTDSWSFMSPGSKRNTGIARLSEEYEPVDTARHSYFSFLTLKQPNGERGIRDDRFSWMTFRSLKRESFRPGTAGSQASSRTRFSNSARHSVQSWWGRGDGSNAEEDIPPVPALPIMIILPHEERRSRARTTGSRTVEWKPDDEEALSARIHRSDEQEED
jgi:hypothetical protein